MKAFIANLRKEKVGAENERKKGQMILLMLQTNNKITFEYNLKDVCRKVRKNL